MKYLSFILILSLFIPVKSTCQSRIFDRDSLSKEAVILSVNSFVQLRKFILTFERDNNFRKFESIHSTHFAEIQLLDSLYKDQLKKYREFVNENAFFGERKKLGSIYLYGMLQRDKLLFYPNVYAVFMNPKRRIFYPKVDSSNYEKAVFLIESITDQYDKMLENLKGKIEDYHLYLSKIPEDLRANIYSGSIPEKDRKNNEIINVLIIINRILNSYQSFEEYMKRK